MACMCSLRLKQPQDFVARAFRCFVDTDFVVPHSQTQSQRLPSSSGFTRVHIPTF